MLTFWVLTKTGLFLIWDFLKCQIRSLVGLILVSFRCREHFTYHKMPLLPMCWFWCWYFHIVTIANLAPVDFPGC